MLRLSSLVHVPIRGDLPGLLYSSHGSCALNGNMPGTRAAGVVSRDHVLMTVTYPDLFLLRVHLGPRTPFRFRRQILQP